MQPTVEHQISHDLSTNLNLTISMEDDDHDRKNEEQEEEGIEIEEEEEEEFSFMAAGGSSSPIAAEDAFLNGQIKPAFPLLAAGDFPMRPPVEKVFVEATSSSAGEWSNRKAVEAGPGPEVCKKSNSTGFSKIWRFKDLLGRSNSDGRDAFVFLNQAPETSATATATAKKKKKKTAAASAHEVYLKSKVKEEEERRRSYLPYRPELMGFFTNVNGGLSKNVHPF
ncbi:uncharacterized protein LOC127241401 [Andrographis paniculata]|uniref:uncharacterized protein LOC127241401 n=1 Tax=Andrographis paniculata TaxID=175694 RepID=UPI0021E826E9|nr:uncharacterized protein LOC127241401 [Andrographis paniculata]